MFTTIGKLFYIEYGQKEYENKEPLEGNDGNGILISSKGDDNGVFGFFDIEDYYRAPLIAVPRVGTIGQAFVQEKDCSVDNNCMVLIPRKKLSKEELFQIAFQIRLNKWKYRYGRQITPERLATQEISLIDSKIDYNNLSQKLLPKRRAKVKIRENKNIKLVKIIDLCEISKKVAVPQNAMEPDGTPYVTTTSKNNGVSDWVGEEPNAKGRCLTVALNGSVGEVFFQFDDFITSGDNAVLTPKNEYNPYLLFYIGYMIKNHQWRYNYYRKLNLKKLEKMMIPVPYDNGGIDLNQIESVVENSYGFDELKKYL
ncbi:MAG: restriction endonuclease subunit S [Candidatus Colwellbacteria bacterium]|nr:restriction endonuclease subunit S [Candidatus Colwellbacteria bacterium]